MSSRDKLEHRSVSLTHGQWNRLKEIAARDNRSVSYVLRNMVQVVLDAKEVQGEQ